MTTDIVLTVKDSTVFDEVMGWLRDQKIQFSSEGLGVYGMSLRMLYQFSDVSDALVFKIRFSEYYREGNFQRIFN